MGNELESCGIHFTLSAVYTVQKLQDTFICRTNWKMQMLYIGSEIYFHSAENNN